jgi:hypothetical protein
MAWQRLGLAATLLKQKFFAASIIATATSGTYLGETRRRCLVGVPSGAGRTKSCSEDAMLNLSRSECCQARKNSPT